MRVLIIGGTRFIGPPIVRELIASGHEVTVFHRGKNRAAPAEGVGEILGDRTDLADFRRDLQSLAPDVALDVIPLTERDARGFVETFRGVAGRVVTISSMDVYRAYDIVRGLHPGPPDPTPLTEDSPLRERLFPYDRPGVEDYEKILVEKTVMDSDLPATVMRLPAVYGPGDYQRRLFPYIKRMDDRRAILLDERLVGWRWTMGFVEDVAHAVALAVTDARAANRVYNVGEREPPTQAELVRSVGDALGWKGEIFATPPDLLPEHLDLGLVNTEQDWTADTSRIREELDFAERLSPEEALHKTIEWERGNPPAEIDPEAFDYNAEDRALQRLR